MRCTMHQELGVPLSIIDCTIDFSTMYVLQSNELRNMGGPPKADSGALIVYVSFYLRFI